MSQRHEPSEESPVVVLGDDECWELLTRAEVGRIAIAPAGQVDIFPVNFAVSDRMIYFRTAPGDKLLELSVNPSVAFEIDGWDATSAYSVIVKGVAERLETQTEIDAADRLGLRPWVPTLKYRWVRILPSEVSGRSFARTAEPEHY